MSEVTEKRPWARMLVWSMAVLLTIWVGWLYRPLTASEKSLLGYWTRADGVVTYQFGRNRRFRAQNWDSGPDRWMYGSWRASDSSVTLSPDFPKGDMSEFPWTQRLRIYFDLIVSSHSAALRWDGRDRMWINDFEFVRGRDE